MSRNDEREKLGTIELLLQLPNQIVALAKAELENAKREAIAKGKKFGIGAGAAIIALFFIFFMLEALIIAAIAALALVWPWWLAALVVAAGLLLLALVVLAVAIWFIRRGNPVPSDTIGRVEGDIEALSDVRFNSDTPDHDPRRPETREAKAARLSQASGQAQGNREAGR